MIAARWWDAAGASHTAEAIVEKTAANSGMVRIALFATEDPRTEHAVTQRRPFGVIEMDTADVMAALGLLTRMRKEAEAGQKALRAARGAQRRGALSPG